MNDSLSWFISLFGLVITIRAIIAPFTWQMYKSGRFNALLRPRRAAIVEEFKDKHDEESIRAMQKKQRELNKEFGINPLAGCMPAIIQLPTVIGLYWALLRMARPEGGLENPVHEPLGFLSAQEVQSFLAGRINNVPLPAYVSMPDDQLAFLNTTRAEVLDFVLPLFITAAVLTALNMIISTFRNFETNDYSSKFSNGMLKTFTVLAVFAPIFPLSLGLTGAFPTAIALYWVTNNLWTLGQTAIMHAILAKKYPLSEDFKEHHAQQRAEYRVSQKDKRAFKWTLRKNRLLMILTPWRFAELRAQNTDLVAERTDRINSEKNARKEIADKRRETQRQMNRESMARLKKRRAEIKAKKEAEKNGLVDAAPNASPDSVGDSNAEEGSGSEVSVADTDNADGAEATEPTEALAEEPGRTEKAD